MIAPLRTKSQSKTSYPYTQEQIEIKFLELLPGITNYAKRAFHGYDHGRRDDAVSEVIAWAFVNIKQLAEAGRLDEAFATPIATFAIGRYRAGRRVGAGQNSTDVTSPHCQLLGRSRVLNAGLADHIADSFESEATAVDARYPVHRTAQLRIDFFQTWLKQQSHRDQQIIRDLAMGETTNDVAKKYGFSAGRISQLRRSYAESWYAFINPVKETDLIEELRELAEAA